MTILRDLLNLGIAPNDAQILDQHFANVNQADFLAGLEQIARAMVSGAVDPTPPTAEPWLSVHVFMTGQPSQAPVDSFNDALASYDAPVQMAITGAISRRMQELQDWLQQTADQGKRKKPDELLKILTNLGYRFRYNMCSRTIEVNGTRINDSIMYDIREKLRLHNVWEVIVAEETYAAEASRNEYHPIKDYFASQKFQGGDPIRELADYFADDRNLFPTLLKRWLIGACARVMAHEQNRMLVLNGKQGLGKDYLAYWLASPFPEYYQEGPIMPDNKDHHIRLMNTWIWDVNELGSTTRRSDREALKSFLTIQTVRERKPFDRFDTQGSAITSFFGSVNNEGGFLNDPTGHRRFMVANILSIDWSYTKLNVDQIWAQAYDLYLSGEPWQPVGDELGMINEINDEFQAVDIVEETIQKYFDITLDANDWMSSLEIAEIMKDPLKGNLKTGSEIDMRRLASALTKVGLDKPVQRKIRGKRERGYYGIKPQF